MLANLNHNSIFAYLLLCSDSTRFGIREKNNKSESFTNPTSKQTKTMSNVAMSSKFIIDSMLPKYAHQFQPFINSHLNNQSQNTNSNSTSVSQTPNSEGSPLTGSEEGGSPNSPPTSKMYPFVSNHPTTHTSYSTMPGFSGLDDKTCG